GKILALVLLYEIHDIRRFGDVGRFLSYARLIRPDHESAGKKCGFGQKKIGNAHLRWALGEAVALGVRDSDHAQKRLARGRKKKRWKGKAVGHPRRKPGPRIQLDTPPKRTLRSKPLREKLTRRPPFRFNVSGDVFWLRAAAFFPRRDSLSRR